MSEENAREALITCEPPLHGLGGHSQRPCGGLRMAAPIRVEITARLDAKSIGERTRLHTLRASARWPASQMRGRHRGQSLDSAGIDLDQTVLLMPAGWRRVGAAARTVAIHRSAAACRSADDLRTPAVHRRVPM